MEDTRFGGLSTEELAGHLVCTGRCLADSKEDAGATRKPGSSRSAIDQSEGGLANGLPPTLLHRQAQCVSAG